MWRTTGVSVALPSKSVCQDAHRHCLLDPDTLFIAVADGAGTAPRADVGANLASQIAVETALAHTCSHGVPEREDERLALVMSALNAAIDALHTLAFKKHVPVDHYAATFILAMVTREQVVAVQIGDGMLFLEDGNGEIVRMTVPQRGEYANETHMLTSFNAADKAQVIVWNGVIKGAAAMTDGLLPITTVLPFYKPYAPFFTNLFEFLRKTGDPAEAEAKLQRFLLSEKVQDGTGDDLTLVIAVPA